MGELKYTLGCFRVSILLPGISGYSWVFPCISGCIGHHQFFEVVSQTLGFRVVSKKYRVALLSSAHLLQHLKLRLVTWPGCTMSKLYADSDQFD